MPIIVVMFCLAAMLVPLGCSPLAPSKPLLPMVEYEKMIVGNLNADYVGTANCIAKCHAHDTLTSYFRKSVHGEQKNNLTSLPLVNCESCHGPGSTAIAKIEETRAKFGEAGNRCDANQLIPLKKLPPQAQSLICLKCHSAASTPALAHWNSSVHALNDVSCISCHSLHHDSRQKVSHETMAELCYSCHQDVKAQFALFSHHPVRERKMNCFDCHDPHGSAQPRMLKGVTQKDTCGRCHGDKTGPFVYEHGDVTETCTNCHIPHGSVNRRLLTAAMPFLCIQCHNPGHRAVISSVPAVKNLYANRCTDCHTTIHGSDTPDNRGSGSLRK
jgi:DmsE family decaheme c-type cytochrome